MVLLQAYGELMDRAPEYTNRYLRLLDSLTASSEPDPLLEAALGRRALRAGGADGTSNAVEHLTKAVKLGFTGATAFEDLAAALSAQGKTADAIEVLKHGIELSPYAPRLYKALVVQYINSAQYGSAKTTMQLYLDIFPEDGFVRDLLRKVGG
jgi:tetratricopeptide (TPR) repeat protein